MTLAFEGYHKALNEAYGDTTQSRDHFGELVAMLEAKGTLSRAYTTDEGETLYTFADGSTLEVIRTGATHMDIRAAVSNGLAAGADFCQIPLGRYDRR